jgi:hypothetical protein
MKLIKILLRSMVIIYQTARHRQLHMARSIDTEQMEVRPLPFDHGATGTYPHQCRIVSSAP